jgi:hypothetical protein
MLGACQGSGLSDDDFDVTAGEHLGRVPVCRTASVRVLDDDAEGTSDAGTDGRAASGATAASGVSSLRGKVQKAVACEYKWGLERQHSQTAV